MIKRYFLSNTPCFIKVDGEFIGEVNDNLKESKINSPFSLVEFLPKNNLYYPVYGDKNCENMRVFTVEDGLLYFPIFSLKKPLPMKVIFQKSERILQGEILLTVITDGEVKIFIDGYFSDVKTLPFIPNDAQIIPLENHVAITIKGAKTIVFLYEISSRKLCFSDVVDSVLFSDVLTVEKNYQTVTKTTLKETWALSPEIKLLSLESFLQIPYRLINKNLLPLAFFENACLGAQLKEIVTPNFYEKSKDLKSFLGNVITATPSPINLEEVWLIENRFVTKGILKRKGDLIDNVILDDF
ncbi:MAG: hypothetical protein E7358_06120 [Clostridiales bacterium]|nr:hypothetical protein [Clostridiales bacterium]